MYHVIIIIMATFHRVVNAEPFAQVLAVYTLAAELAKSKQTADIDIHVLTENVDL